jgi:hypothetical protein
MTGDTTVPRTVRPRAADRANLSDLWAWAYGGRDVVGMEEQHRELKREVREQLRDIKREVRGQTYILVGAVLACNPITVHVVQPLLKGLGSL